MTDYCIVINNAIVFGPQIWDPFAFSKALTANGILISWANGTPAPSGTVDLGNGSFIAAVTYGDKPSFNAMTQKLVTGTPSIGAGTVTIGYTATALSTDEQTSAQESLCAAVDAFRDARLAAGFADTGAGGTGKTWECDNVTAGHWTALAASAMPWALGLVTANPPTFAPWGTDNVPVTLTASQAFALFDGRVLPWVQSVYDYARQMKANVRAGNPPADYTAGWP